MLLLLNTSRAAQVAERSICELYGGQRPKKRATGRRVLLA
jgi:hypothetical protein